MDRKELLMTYTKRCWMANTANDITGLLLDYEKHLKIVDEREQVKNCSIPDASKSFYSDDAIARLKTKYFEKGLKANK